MATLLSRSEAVAAAHSARERESALAAMAKVQRHVEELGVQSMLTKASTAWALWRLRRLGGAMRCWSSLTVEQRQLERDTAMRRQEVEHRAQLSQLQSQMVNLLLPL